MTYLCINNINNISLSNISIKENNHNYKIFYNSDEIITYGISFHCKGIIKKYEDIYLSSMMKLQEGNTIQEQLKKDVRHRSLIIKLKNTTPDQWRKRWRLISRLAEIGLDYKPSFLLSN